MSLTKIAFNNQTNFLVKNYKKTCSAATITTRINESFVSCKEVLISLFSKLGKEYENKLDKIMTGFKADGITLAKYSAPLVSISELEKAQEHSLCAKLAKNCYADKHVNQIGNTRLNQNYSVNDKEKGFHGCVYESDNTIYISYRGTNDSKDIANDIDMFFYNIPEQYKPALELYKKVARDNLKKNKKIVVTGHSLGGSLAQLVAATKFTNGLKAPTAVTFNAYGTKNMIKYENSGKFIKYPQSTNYSIKNDFIGYAREHIGKNFYLPANLKDQAFSAHSIENFTKPETLGYFIEAQNQTKNIA